MQHTKNPEICPDPCPECVGDALQTIFDALLSLEQNERIAALKAVSILFDVEVVS